MNSFKEIKEGEFIQHVTGGTVYIVTGHYGRHITLTQTREASNPTEWNKFNVDDNSDSEFIKWFNGTDYGDPRCTLTNREIAKSAWDHQKSLGCNKSK